MEEKSNLYIVAIVGVVAVVAMVVLVTGITPRIAYTGTSATASGDSAGQVYATADPGCDSSYPFKCLRNNLYYCVKSEDVCKTQGGTQALAEQQE